MIFLDKLIAREESGTLRSLPVPSEGIDFFSNDYLGLARNAELQKAIAKEISDNSLSHGSTGSRLLSGNNAYAQNLEKELAAFFQSESALLFNSGYDANAGLIQALSSRDDILLYDELIHASIRDGITLSRARGWSFRHNDMEHLENRLKLAREKNPANIFVFAESIYSMDGDTAPLRDMTALCAHYAAHCILDEAHAGGVYGEGLAVRAGLQNHFLARVITFGKAWGAHGAVVLASDALIQLLVNFARPLIYSTALPPSSLAAIRVAVSWATTPLFSREVSRLQENISFFVREREQSRLGHWLPSTTAIQSFVTGNVTAARTLAEKLGAAGFLVRPILSPTVPQGTERLRIVLHSFNTQQKNRELVSLIK